ncbi:peptidoglycan bridge formation glycyltransferase FemA/FemB family protein [Pareuzebyella sediminis]|uniref:peptidoglycan bridge formation glycyltransferase FemA/FemB family protein n=1 Tax=Pareuzebyella sediminis TaxID=2607998 RepID=UPI0011EE29EE|nr:peptidoglycan bridge formation glycyltransferase FemA/FemB family protein [Pareuzebyella sediminis]
MIFEITSRKEWMDILESVDTYDVYHTYDYHQLSLKEFERAILMVYVENDALVGIPLIIRPIPDTNLFDATSVYGYPGPVSAGITSDFDASKMAKQVHSYLRENNIVTVFSRLNPYIHNQSLILGEMGSINIAGPIVGIDLTLNITQQRERFSRRLKTQLNKAERNIIVREGNGMEDLALFHEIYTESMDRLNAVDCYYFPLQYFIDLFDSDQINAKLLLAECKTTGQVMAGSIFTLSKDIVQYHLSGTYNEFLDAMPSKLLIDYMRKHCSNKSFLHLNLGGGLGSNTDGLFRFKKSFSPSLRSFTLWSYIVNKKAYKKLVKKHKAKNLSDTLLFPEYRR